MKISEVPISYLGEKKALTRDMKAWVQRAWDEHGGIPYPTPGPGIRQEYEFFYRASRRTHA